ncbi:DUF1673 family protein [Methanosarcina barkeri]|uniref:DUF1673 family protein n=1 Tax=Methanosarcina barkeri TaxID=2208 RepID=UPI00064EA053|nr:DUF1673 family protein [Methanosarcina barkeri]
MNVFFKSIRKLMGWCPNAGTHKSRQNANLEDCNLNALARTSRKNGDTKRMFNSKSTVIKAYILLIWLNILIIALIATKIVLYNSVKYFFRATSISIPLFFYLFLKGEPSALSIQESKKELILLSISFICLMATIFLAMMNSVPKTL